MPVKVRCSGCQKSLTAPEKLYGKTVKCPNCGVGVSIPAESSAASPTSTAKPAAPPPGGTGASEAAAKKSAPTAAPNAAKTAAPSSGRQPAAGGKTVKAAARPKTPADFDASSSGEFFTNLASATAGEGGDTGLICPYCAEPYLNEDETVCRNCGMDSGTGKMDRREARRRSMRGPDSREFWAACWTDPIAFVKENRKIALRTGTFWTIFALCACGCYYMAAEFCKNPPTKAFWYAMMALSGLGLPGWYWALSIRLVQAEMFQEKVQTDRIHFDFLLNVAVGLRAIFWPLIILLPATIPVAGWLAYQHFAGPGLPDQRMLMILAAIPMVLTPLLFPLATIHMAAKHKFKAWIGWELLKTFFQLLGPCLYGAIQWGLLLGPIVGVFAAIQFFGGGANPFLNTHFQNWSVSFTSWFYGLLGESTAPGSLMFIAVQAPVKIVLAFAMLAPLTALAGFPALFMMRVNSLLVHYFQTTIDPVNRMRVGTPAGFWVRLLTFWGDMALFPLSSFLVLREKRAVIVGQLLNAAGVLLGIFRRDDVRIITIWGVLFTLYNFWMYFAVQESGGPRATIVKESFGLVVNTEKGKQMTLKQATVRWFCGLMSLLSAGLGFLMCAFHPRKKALHDLLSKTEVVFRGDK